MIKKAKNTVLWRYVICDLKGEEIVGTLYKKELQKTNQKDFRVEEVIKKEGYKLYFNGKATIVFLIAGLIKKILLYKNELFSTL